MKVVLFGREGKVGASLAPHLETAGHSVVGVELGEATDLAGCDAAIDFTEPSAVHGNMSGALAAGVPCIVGTSGLTDEAVADLNEIARAQSVPCLIVPNFAIGAVLMMRFAETAAAYFDGVEIVELHHDTKVDAPSGTAKATAARLGGDVPVHSVRLPGLVAHQEVILGTTGQTLTLRHDTTSRDAFAPGVLIALEGLGSLPPGVSHGLDVVLDARS